MEERVCDILCDGGVSACTRSDRATNLLRNRFGAHRVWRGLANSRRGYQGIARLGRGGVFHTAEREGISLLLFGFALRSH